MADHEQDDHAPLPPDEAAPQSEDRDDWKLDATFWANTFEAVQEAERREGAAFPGGQPFLVTHREVELADVPDEGEPLMSAAGFYAVNDRPVKLVPTADGGLDVQVLNLRTGEFERDMSYLSRCLFPEGDVDQFPDEAAFDCYVESVRRNLPRHR